MSELVEEMLGPVTLRRPVGSEPCRGVGRLVPTAVMTGVKRCGGGAGDPAGMDE